MKKYWIIGLIIPFLSLFSCMDDTSAYLPQEKEEVEVDQVTVDTTTVEEVLPEGQLVPGVHLVKLQLPSGDTTVERRFKYFMPISIDVSRPISLIFEFHGSIEFEAGVNPKNPLDGISIGHSLCQLAIKENCIICFPAGVAEFKADSSGAVNWAGDNYKKSLPFVDAMLEYFRGCTPRIDDNRIYSTGQSSGAIFSFVLAFERSEVFAAITPRAGQMALDNQAIMPERAVPVRVFAGVNDTTVRHASVINNMTAWAERIGGYFASDMVFTEDSLEIEDYKKVDTRIWSGGNADYQIFSLKEETHYINVTKCTPYMWEFMQSHPLDGNTSLYITSDIKEVSAQCGETVKVAVNYSDGAVFEAQAPKGWTLQSDGKNISLTAPTDFYGNVDREGNLTLTVTLNGQEFTKDIPCTLVAPKLYFEVGDIYYNDDFEPVGVVCWVNPANIREAKIVNIDKQNNSMYNGNGNPEPGLGLDFSTPDRQDGAGNTKKMVDKNKTLSTPFTASNAAFMWAATYTYKGETDWYLPAIDELASMAPYIDRLNSVITELGGVLLKPLYTGDFVLYSSTNEVEDGADRKTFYSYNFAKKTIVANKSTDKGGGEYIGWCQTRLFKKVSK